MSEPRELLWAELATRADVSLAQVLAVGRMPDGRLVWLERGDERAGWVHICQKSQNFADRGIDIADLQTFLMTALLTGKWIGQQGTTREVYEVLWQGEIQYVSITIGSNGFIVGANPTSKKLIRRLKNAESN